MAPGLNFCAVDLHIHTPASKCFRGTVTPEEYVAQAIRAGMRAIAITDHNTGDWIDRIKEAAAGTSLTVFPGVEISVAPGVHILAIFPEDRGTAHVNDLLAMLRVRADQRGEQDALVTEFGVQRVISMIRAENALPVLAHIDDHSGAWNELRGSGQTLVQLWAAAEFAAVEIVGDSLPREIGSEPFMHIPACYWASDNPHPDDPSRHSHLGIGSRSSLFKLEEPITWEGLRLCFHDPDVRIRRLQPDAPIRVRHPAISRVQVQGGFLDGLDLVLNPNLNCIIGGRGTGKSTLLEVVRHAFGIDAKTDANRRQATSILNHAFPPGSQITVECTTGDGAQYRVVRISGRPPQVHRADTGALLSMAPMELMPIQAYGQKEIYEIAQDPQFQLQLIDHYVADAIAPLQEQENALLRQLEQNASTILQLQESIANAEERLASVDVIREELRRMAEMDFVTRLEVKNAYDREQRLLNRLQARTNRLRAGITSLIEGEQTERQIIASEESENLPNRALLAAQQSIVDTIFAEFDANLQMLADRIDALWAEGSPQREQWRLAFSQEDSAYQTLLREFQASGGALRPERYVQLQQRLTDLDDLAQHTIRERQQLTQQKATRTGLLSQLRAGRRQQYEVRREKAAELTNKLNKNVRVTIHPQGNRAKYQQHLTSLCTGLGVRSATIEQITKHEAERPEREGQRPVNMRGETRYLIPRIPAYLDPVDLAAAIRQEKDRADGAPSPLEQTYGTISDSMRHNLTRLSDAQLFGLETFAVPDLPLIELRVGNGELGYRELSALSVGQKCTALLSIVLLESPATLLVDQPEDDLDNQFIFDQIVETLRREKERRQFLIATHNANIPVSGDAELIVVVQADNQRGSIVEQGVGSIDALPIKHAVERILEGGERAFQIRREKYGLK
jgi:ABC-type dipeptide/oligopeptide/nickel transport system ATPase component